MEKACAEAKLWKEEFFRYLRKSTVKKPLLEEARVLKQKFLPKRIYKYRADNEHARQGLTANTIWLASPDSYNDPFDCVLSFSESDVITAFERGAVEAYSKALGLPSEKVSEAMNSASPFKALIEIVGAVEIDGAHPKDAAQMVESIGPDVVKLIANIVEIPRALVKLCSFSAVMDSILMWSHYANNHSGFCIEYSLERFEQKDAFLKNLYPVVYSNELFEVTEWVQELFTGKRDDLNTTFALLGVLQKYEGWAYEEEWRYVVYGEAVAPNRTRRMPPPSRVFLGAKASLTTINEVVTICDKMEVPVSQMRMSSDRFQLLSD